jgi:hypothetical protein
MAMRELTDYEREKWFDDIGRFNAPEFLETGCEPDEAYHTVERATEQRDYGLADWFVEAAQVQALDMYYDQVVWYYTEAYDEPEDHGLPPLQEFEAKAKELGVESMPDYGQSSDDIRRLWDWAMEWREEHRQETKDRLEAKYLQERLDQINKNARRM